MNISKSILEKYFKGTCTEEEQLLVEAYLEEKEHPELDAVLVNTWMEVNNPPARVFKLWYAAASAVAASVIGILCFFLVNKPAQTATIALATDTIYNNSNKAKLYKFPDGSEIWLNANSKLAFNTTYNKQGREIWLQGEALFKVASQSDQPFNVHTRHLTTQVLGTTFQVATNNLADGSIQVSLLEGKVAVTNENGFTKILHPGEMLTHALNDRPVIKPFDSNEILDWKNDKIIFNKTSLADAVTRLSQRFNKEIVLADKTLGTKKVSGEFKINTSVNEILEALVYVHNLDLKKTNDHTFLINIKK
ncbi:DUF4974 domain-containing protein [Chitinophaga silvatica]|uniref:DUF4974 domain-containing protein n=1 Tax=Chitinophaga silvatica TaxID=2282649 RepID=A0A3E1Y9R3_9BACT|nr:FecR domain-containing protein [Chitinophaga silvatica]RFS22408.1 DUF4974 domain-containing protein [Chitinophaga silvatica]